MLDTALAHRSIHQLLSMQPGRRGMDHDEVRREESRHYSRTTPLLPPTATLGSA